LRSVRGAVESFGYPDAGRFFANAAAEPHIADPMLLSSIDTAASLLGSPSIAMADLIVRLAELGRGNTVDRAIGMAFGPLDQPRRTPGATPAVNVPDPRPSARKTPSSPRALGLTPGRGTAPVGRRTPLTPTGPELRQFLQSGIAGFTELDQTPLAAPAPLDDATLVPIDDLVYRGRAALERAIEVRDLIRLSGGNNDDALAELFDLLDLAAAD
jgi:hypothetical protein